MLSDVLFQAIDDFRRYQRTYPNVYAEVNHRIDEIVTKMLELKDILDTPSVSRRDVH